MKLLVIEDEIPLQDSIKAFLEKERYVVEVASDFHTAMQKLFAFEYDCVILDIMLPFGSGLDVLKALEKEGKSSNVIIISAKDSLEDKITGLNLGADDYLTKPFHNAELNARIKAILRRKNRSGGNTMEVANVMIDFDERAVKINQFAIGFNRKEFDILSYLIVNANRLVTHVALAEYVWGDHIEDADNFDFIYSQVKNLRKKLQDAGSYVKIRSIYGVGYKLEEV